MAQMELSSYTAVVGGRIEVRLEFYKNDSLLASFLSSSIYFAFENAFLVGL